MRRALLLVLAAALLGCSSQTKKFDVLVTDSNTLLCDAIAVQPQFAASNLTSLAQAQEEAWRQEHQLTPAVPVGRVLHYDVVDGDVSAWFEASFDSTQQLGPSEVYVGPEVDDEIDATFIAMINPQPTVIDEGDGAPTMAMDVCGDLEETRAEMLTTLYSGDVDGRIRRLDSTYFTLGETQCDVAVRCRRDIKVDGAEE